MKKVISIIMVVVQIFVLTAWVNAAETQPTDYDLYYPQFVDSTEPLSSLQQMDYVINRAIEYEKHPEISTMPDEYREDYYDIAYGTDPLQKLDIHHLKGSKSRPVIFAIHGGGWTFGDKSSTYSRFFAKDWVALGYTVVSINYRLGPKDPHPAQIEDCAMALKWVIDNIDKYGGNSNRIAIQGHSAGAHLAALLVTDIKWQQKYGIDINKVKCWMAWSGIYDFNLKENYYHPMMAEFNAALLDSDTKKDDASPITHITGNEPPCQIVHGGDDWLVPKSNSIVFADKLKKKGVNVDLRIIKGYWHSNVLINFGEPGHVTTQISKEFLAKYLPTSLNNPGDYKDDEPNDKE